MTSPNTTDHTALVAELNDLLQLDHDAVNAYAIAIESIQDVTWRESLVRYREDHQRHIADLTTHIRALGGTPIQLQHIPTGLFKAGVQAAAGAAGGDRAILLAFKSNEGQARDKYARAALAAHPTSTAVLLRRNADDEEQHYRWVSAVLETLGAGADTTVGKAEAAFERVHGGAATALEGVEKAAMRGASKLRRGYKATSPTVKAVVGVGLALMVVRKLMR